MKDNPKNAFQKFIEKDLSRRGFLAHTAGFAAGTALVYAGCRTTGKSTVAPSGGKESSDKMSSSDNLDGWPLDKFGVSQESAKKVMARAMSRGGTFADLYFQRNSFVSLGVEDSSVNKASSGVDMGVGVRVVRGNETGYAFSESLDEKSMLKAAEVAAAIASSGPKKDRMTFNVAPVGGFYPTGNLWEKVGAEQKVSMLSNLDKRVRSKDPRIKQALLNYYDVDNCIVVIDSDGKVVEDRQPMAVLSVGCIGEHKGRRESNSYATAGRAGFDFFTEERLERVASEAVNRTTILFNSVAGPVGEMPVVLAPGSSGILLHEAIGHGMEADFARKKLTIYTDMIGKRIAPDFVNIIDDGTNKGMRGSINIDDEARDSQRTVLVENGIFRTFMHDRISAGHFKLSPTGNGRRQSFRHMPIPRMRNTYMTNGPHDPEEIIKSVDKGIYAVSFTNGQVNIGAGDFTFYVKTGYLIEKGKLTAPIKDINIIGNGPKVLENVTMAGNDLAFDENRWTCGKRGQGVPVGLGLPTVKVSSITVGGTSRKEKAAAAVTPSGRPSGELSGGPSGDDQNVESAKMEVLS